MRNFSVCMIYLWTFVNVGRPQDIFPIIGKISPGVLVAALSLVSYLLSNERAQQNRLSIWDCPEVKLFVAFAITMVISAPFGYYPRMSLEFLKDFILKFGLYLYLVMKLITTRERVVGLFWTLLICGLAMGIAAFFQPESDLRTFVGTTYDPNDLAMLMVTILPLCFVPIFMPGKFQVKMASFIGTVFILIAIVATRSRGGFIGLIVITLAGLVLRIPNVSGSKKMFLILLSCLLFVAVAGPVYWNRISTIRDYEADESGRILVWKRSLVIATSHPILGVGPDAFMTAYGDFLEKDRFPKELSRRTTGVRVWQTAHSAYLLVLVELGIPGLLLFLAINYHSLRNLRKIRQLDLSEAGKLRTLQLWSSGLTISLVGFLTCGLFISQSYNTLIYLICALSGSILRIITPSQVNASNAL